MEIPEKTIERLSHYRRFLFRCLDEGKGNIFSHQLAALMHNTPEQVRRDFMLIGYSGSQSKGYDIRSLIDLISSIIDTPEGQKVAIVGMGNLGRAIVSYFSGKRAKLSIIAAFDNDLEKTNRIIAGIHCYHIEKMAELIKKENISIGVITVPSESAIDTVNLLVKAGIKGILNYTSAPLKVPNNVFLEEYNIITSLEKVAYFSKKFKNDDLEKIEQ